ncbi:MAG: PBP1A family penicillin-binding protein, partial [bacterium]|nr:PBP1A family penicillin-binding protein [bacterium]
MTRRDKWRWLFKWLGYGIGGFVLFVLLLFAVYAKDLPNPNNLSSRQVAQSTKILDRNGNPLYEIFNEERRTIVTSDKISPYIKQATVAVEDADFYQHHGLDARSIMRAALADITGQTKYTQGGSTITQQFIKNALLTKEKRISRKIKEAILSVEIETIYSKDEILTGYINEIAYGNNAYGIESAARTYFNKSASDLTLSEAATLAALPQRPSYLSPYGQHLPDLFKRKELVLDQMARRGYIKQEEADVAKKEAPTKDNLTFAKRDETIRAPHFVFYVRDQLIELLGDNQDAEQLLATNGYTVTTTLDLTVQDLAEKAIADTAPAVFERRGATNTALVASDPATGDILAMVGSVNYFDEKFGSVNVTTSPRQPGSSFKPIVYALALEGKYSPASTLFDLTTDFGGGYVPNNYDGHTRGPVSLRFALANSLNIPAVRVLDLVGLDEALNLAHKLGITTLNDREKYGLSIVLGAGEVKLVDMVHAYSVFANQGKKMPLTSILKVVDKNNQTLVDITQEERQGDQVINQQTAFLLSDILSDNSVRAAIFGSSLAIPGHTVAVKTGTTQSFRDAWTIGYTPQIAAGVWVGNNDNSEMRSGADGSVTAAPIWRKFMTSFLSDKENKPFPRPGEVKRIEVDKLSAKLPNDKCSGDRVSDWFASWNVPKEQDDVQKEVKIDKVSLKLATDKTPADQIDYRCYRTIHSERPNKPNWEGPVAAWAVANGYNGIDQPPNDYDDVHTEAKRPTVTFIKPTDNQNIDNSFEATTQANGSFPIVRVSYYLDDSFVKDANSSPYSATFSGLSSGSHKLKAVATDQVGNQGELTITINVKENSAPGLVSNVTTSAGSGSVTLGWTNPTDADLATVRVYESTSSGNPGSLAQTVTDTKPGTTSSVVLSGRAKGTYYYILRAVDNNNNENTTNSQVAVSVP